MTGASQIARTAVTGVETARVRIDGFPYRLTEREVREFLAALNLNCSGVEYVLNPRTTSFSGYVFATVPAAETERVLDIVNHGTYRGISLVAELPLAGADRQ